MNSLFCQEQSHLLLLWSIDITAFIFALKVSFCIFHPIRVNLSKNGMYVAQLSFPFGFLFQFIRYLLLYRLLFLKFQHEKVLGYLNASPLQTQCLALFSLLAI